MDTDTDTYEVIVIGAGIAGSATAYNIAAALQNSGGEVLLLEQFSVLHTRGNSHGKSRVTRRVYDEPYYVHMMDECFRMWDQLEKESGSKIYTKTGILVFGEECCIQGTVSSLESNGIAFDRFSGEEANKRWPDQLKLPSSYTCVLEKDGGILAPEEALKAYQSLFVKRGGVLLADCPVTDIIPGDTVQVVTSKGIMFGKKVVLTVGPWAQKWADKLDLPHIKFKSMRGEVFYWRSQDPKAFQASSFPVFCQELENKRCMYGLPIFEYPGLLKIANSLGPVIASPEARDEDPTTKYRDEVAQFIGQCFKGISREVDTYEPCIVTYTPTRDPILDFHPKFNNIIFGVGLSGHGFKLSPVIGKILCELALGTKPSYDLTPFRLDRTEQ